MKTLFCIIGRSATGKDTLTNKVCEELGLQRVISHTSRSPRQGEKDGVDYYFSDAIQLFEEKEIFAQTLIGVNYYWTTVEEVINKDIYIIDPLGLYKLYENNKENNIRIVTIYITAPKSDCDKRAYSRDQGNYQKYLEKCAAENEQFNDFESHKLYDYCVHNVHFEIALQQLKTIIEAERKNIYAF